MNLLELFNKVEEEVTLEVIAAKIKFPVTVFTPEGYKEVEEVVYCIKHQQYHLNLGESPWMSQSQ